jgi:Family of unknown function (DUF6447)
LKPKNAASLPPSVTEQATDIEFCFNMGQLKPKSRLKEDKIDLFRGIEFMDTIKIDDKEYKFSDLSEDARAQLLSLQATDAKISELQRDMAIAQTARMAYARALNELLPQAEKSH